MQLSEGFYLPHGILHTAATVQNEQNSFVLQIAWLQAIHAACTSNHFEFGIVQNAGYGISG